jgi:hypothetical protein
MKVSSVILALLNAILASTVTAAPLVGHSRALEDDKAKVSLEELARGIPDLLSRVSQPAGGRRLSSPLDKLDVLIKNVDCFACMVSNLGTRKTIDSNTILPRKSQHPRLHSFRRLHQSLSFVTFVPRMELARLHPTTMSS